jgi:NhaP-type Na+/H+ or K+/H+ antiporter
MNKKLHHSITDFASYGHILLSLSVFFFIGMLLPTAPTSNLEQLLVLITIALFLAGAFYFYKKALYYKKKLLEEEN